MKPALADVPTANPKIGTNMLDDWSDDLTEDDIEAILEKFVTMGMATRTEFENGDIGYQITDLGIAVHESYSVVKN